MHRAGTDFHCSRQPRASMHIYAASREGKSDSTCCSSSTGSALRRSGLLAVSIFLLFAVSLTGGIPSRTGGERRAACGTRKQTNVTQSIEQIDYSVTVTKTKLHAMINHHDHYYRIKELLKQTDQCSLFVTRWTRIVLRYLGKQNSCILFPSKLTGG